ncbi:CRTAC1 family protein, partial [candidate division TA06 bacterium]|nr:CRTAC1 family protein [candidate division TA06 bacterium]
MGSGAAFLDYDNDGNLDLYIVNSGPLPGFGSEEVIRNLLYRNEGDGTFTYVTEEAGVGDTGYGMGVSVGDLDNDGYPDIFVTNFGPNLLYHNNGDGTFTDVTRKAGVGDDRWGCSAAFLDYDGDGYLDLYVTNYLDFTFDNHKFCGDPVKNIRAYCHPDHYNGVEDILYRNNGDGTFSDVTKAAGVSNPEGKGLGVICFDYDNDGDTDIYITNDSVRNFLYRNNGDGTFTDVTLFTGAGYNEDGKTEAGMGTDFGDYDHDGYFDIFVTNLDYETNTLYHNDEGDYFADLTFLAGLGEPSIDYVGWGTNFIDYDNDGDEDLFLTNGHVIDNINLLNPNLTVAQRDFLFENRGDGTFADVSSQSGEYFSIEKVGRGTAFGDYDNDGDVDLFVTNSNDTPNLLRNDGGNQNNWLMIKTLGRQSNRDGIGTRISVVSGDLIQMDEVKSGSSYLCQNDLRVHFGLGKRRQVDRVEIR